MRLKRRRQNSYSTLASSNPMDGNPNTSARELKPEIKGEIENSIIMDHCHIDINEKITDSFIGPHSTITSSENTKPKGRRFIIGERSYLTN